MTEHGKDINHYLCEFSTSEDLWKSEVEYIRYLQGGSKILLNYAINLVRSKNKAEVKRGIIYLEELFNFGEASTKDQTVLYLAAGHIKLNQNYEAVHYIDLISESDPKFVTSRQFRKFLKTSGFFDLAKIFSFASGFITASVILYGAFYYFCPEKV